MTKETNRKGPSFFRRLTSCAYSIGMPANAGKSAISCAIRERTGWEDIGARALIDRYFDEVVKEVLARHKKTKRTGRALTTPIRRPTTRSPDYVSDPSFYDSRAWMEIRYFALVLAAGKCQCCGKSKKDGATLHVDHIKPRFTHPGLSLDVNNLQVLCRDCNLGKGAWDSTDWR